MSTPPIASSVNTLKSVIIVTDFGHIVGGREKVSIDSALALAAAGLEVVYFCAVGPPDSRMASNGIRVICLNHYRMTLDPSPIRAAQRGLWSHVAAASLKAVIAEYDPATTVVHIHGYLNTLSASLAPIITKAGVRHVWTMHDYFMACPNMRFFDFAANQVCHRKPLSSDCVLHNCGDKNYAYKAFWLLQTLVARIGGLPANLRHVIYISQLQKQIMQPYLNANTQLHYVPNLISISRQPRIEVERNQHFVFVGRLEIEKGILDFAEAAKSSALSAVFVGDGDSADDIVATLPSAHITGWLAPKAVQQWLARARALVFPSLWYECQPLVVYEAIAMGVPVITYDISAARECITAGVNGEVVNIEQRSAGLATALNKLTDPGTARAQSIAAYDGYWQSPLSMQLHIDNLLKVYNRL